MKLRIIEKNEYKTIAEIHLVAFKDFFLTSLGKRFLRVYYRASLKSRESLSVCGTDEEGKIQGFCIGCVKSKGYHKRLLKNNFFLFLFEGLIVIFSKPASLVRLVKNMDKIGSSNDDGNYAELLSIAVSPDQKGFGLGKQLMYKFEEEATKNGCKRIALTTDYFNNRNVLSFYEKAGYVIYYEFTAFPNRRMYKLIKDL
jgi:ribosomal protein S18 acetylase RimI-like enzyme